jgi:hypothetical protein
VAAGAAAAHRVWEAYKIFGNRIIRKKFFAQHKSYLFMILILKHKKIITSLTIKIIKKNILIHQSKLLKFGLLVFILSSNESKVCKHLQFCINIVNQYNDLSNWEFVEIIGAMFRSFFPIGFAGLGVFNNDSTIGLDGARPPSPISLIMSSTNSYFSNSGLTRICFFAINVTKNTLRAPKQSDQKVEKMLGPYSQNFIFFLT